MQFSTIAGISLVFAIAISRCAAQFYKYCIPFEGLHCPIRGIEMICSLDSAAIYDNCLRNQQKCTTCYFDYRNSFIEDLLDLWCRLNGGHIESYHQSYGGSPSCDINNNDF
jgi:hypothetical protein